MKFLFPLIVIVIASVVYFYFFGNPQSIRLFGNTASSPPAGAQNNRVLPGKNSAGTGHATSSNFKGPQGAPGAGFVGPPGPPPNY